MLQIFKSISNLKDLRWLDGNTTFLFVLTCISETSFTSLGTSNNTSLGHLQISTRQQKKQHKLSAKTTNILVNKNFYICKKNGVGLITYQGIGQGGFTMIDVGNDGHVTDVPFLVHQTTDFIDGEVDLRTQK